MGPDDFLQDFSHMVDLHSLEYRRCHGALMAGRRHGTSFGRNAVKSLLADMMD
jgi:hypothetical protein